MKYAIVSLVLVSTLALSASYTSVSQCDEYASQGQYINAGLCYQFFDKWDKCSYYLLKGAREAELRWNYNMNNYDDYSLAVNYYGDITQRCLKNWGEKDLAGKVLIYHDWLQHWLVNRDNPPFDMGQLIEEVKDKIWPSEKQGVVPSVVNKTKSVMQKIKGRGQNATAPSETSQNQEIDLALVIVGVGVVIAVIILVVAMMLHSKPGQKEELKSSKE